MSNGTHLRGPNKKKYFGVERFQIKYSAVTNSLLT